MNQPFASSIQRTSKAVESVDPAKNCSNYLKDKIEYLSSFSRFGTRETFTTFFFAKIFNGAAVELFLATLARLISNWLD